jgi:hypothetical protein
MGGLIPLMRRPFPRPRLRNPELFAEAANLMREPVALNVLDVVLAEHDGRWRGRGSWRASPRENVLARIVDLTASCVERGLMDRATLCIGKRSYTIHAAAEAGIPACAA